MTRIERKAANKQAHAIRRSCTDTDYRQAKQAGQSITWRQVWDTYASIDTATVIASLDVAPVKVKPAVKRKASGRVTAIASEYRLARESWEAGLAVAMAGGRTLAEGGKPARGEKYPDEERDYRAANPAPVYRDFLKQAGRESRGIVEAAVTSGRMQIVSVSA